MYSWYENRRLRRRERRKESTSSPACYYHAIPLLFNTASIQPSTPPYHSLIHTQHQSYHHTVLLGLFCHPGHHWKVCGMKREWCERVWGIWQSLPLSFSLLNLSTPTPTLLSTLIRYQNIYVFSRNYESAGGLWPKVDNRGRRGEDFTHLHTLTSQKVSGRDLPFCECLAFMPLHEGSSTLSPHTDLHTSVSGAIHLPDHHAWSTR